VGLNPNVSLLSIWGNIYLIRINFEVAGRIEKNYNYPAFSMVAGSNPVNGIISHFLLSTSYEIWKVLHSLPKTIFFIANFHVQDFFYLKNLMR
jgi:hypothetical protein